MSPSPRCGVTEALKRARSGVGHLVKIELEVDTLDQLREALDHGVDAAGLDKDTGTLTEAG
jgi:nicotinate-nucleotide pyrophosphorylase (carboxylating)